MKSELSQNFKVRLTRRQRLHLKKLSERKKQTESSALRFIIDNHIQTNTDV